MRSEDAAFTICTGGGGIGGARDCNEQFLGRDLPSSSRLPPRDGGGGGLLEIVSAYFEINSQVVHISAQKSLRISKNPSESLLRVPQDLLSSRSSLVPGWVGESCGLFTAQSAAAANVPGERPQLPTTLNPDSKSPTARSVPAGVKDIAALAIGSLSTDCAEQGSHRKETNRAGFLLRLRLLLLPT